MFKRLFLSVAVMLAAVGSAQAQTGADVNISPKRVVFTPGERTATVYIFNQGDREATYTIELTDRVMLPTGEITAAADHPDVPVASAADLIQYTPRRVVLGPRQSQAIRVRARPSGEGDGERRTHLTVTALPSEDVGFTAEQAAQGETEGLSIRVSALFSLSIPLIVRDRPADARASLENPILASQGDGRLALGLDIVRLGADSVYGDLEVHAVRNGRDRLVTAVRGVAVYRETPRRAMTVPLPEAIEAGETLRVTYRDQDARPGTELATVTLTAP